MYLIGLILDELNILDQAKQFKNIGLFEWLNCWNRDGVNKIVDTLKIGLNGIKMLMIKDVLIVDLFSVCLIKLDNLS